MAKLCLKKPSKRMPAKRRYKIQKKIREHNRKKRKETKRLAQKPNRKLIPIPNICPFKENILQDVELYKQRQKEEKEQARERAKAEREAKKATNLQELAEQSQQKQLNYEDENEKSLAVKTVSNYKTFYREFQKVVAAADIILEIVDARDPLGTRCATVEEAVRAGGKKLVLVLNKADLVPREILDKWLKYLRKRVPCIPFKASTQTQSKKLGRGKMKGRKDVRSSAICVGADGLMSLLANYTRNNGIKTAIRVGVVGIPNVGKSSLINSLKRTKVCQVGAVPGVTRSVQEIQLDSKIKLLDSPGLAFVSPTDPHAALKNLVKVVDPIEPCDIIIQRANKEQMMKLYLVNEYNSTTEFLTSLAQRYGKYKKGGVVDLEASAKILVDDWNRGKIEYFCVPPEDNINTDVSCAIVSSDVAEFDLDAYDAQVLPDPGQSMDTSEGGVDEGEFKLVVKGARKHKQKEEKSDELPASLMQLEGNLRLNKLRKVQAKKDKKKKVKQERAANELASAFSDVKLELS